MIMIIDDVDNLSTVRSISDGLEKILYKQIDVLDKGFIRVLDYMGNDSSVVQAARVSYGKGVKKYSQDESLINYLMRNQHTSPFEMCEIKFHIKLPIFVARQWVRHRTASINEYSARYSVVKGDFYIPSIENVKKQSKINNQGREDDLDEDCAREFIDLLSSESERSYKNYEDFLTKDISREISRMGLPLNCYTEWYWKVDLHNLLRFIKLRGSNHAQYEIREYASVLLSIVKDWVPLTYDAFVNYIRDSVTFSKNSIELLKKRFRGEDINRDNLKFGKSEFRDIMNFIEDIETD